MALRPARGDPGGELLEERGVGEEGVGVTVGEDQLVLGIVGDDLEVAVLTCRNGGSPCCPAGRPRSRTLVRMG